MNADGFAPLRRVAQEAIAASVAQHADLGYLKDVAGFPGFPAALSRTLEDLRLSRVSLEQLRVTGRSGADLAILADRYDRELNQRRLADYAARVEYAIARARTMTPRPILLVDLDVRTTAESELLSVLLARAPEKFVITRTAPPDPPANCLDSVRRFAFSGSAVPSRPADASVSVISSFERIDRVCRDRPARAAIRYSVRPYRDSASAAASARAAHPRSPGTGRHPGVVRPRDAQAGSWRASVSDAAGLPRGELQRGPVRGIPVARTGPEGGRASAFSFPMGESVAQGGGDRGGRPVECAADGCSRPGYREYQKEPTERTANDIGGLEELRGFAVPLMEKLAALPQRATWGEWIARFEELAVQVLEWPQTLHEALDELRPIADLGPVSLPEVRRTLERRLRDFDEPVEGYRYGKVFVAPIEQARGMQFRLVFIPAMSEGSFPQPLREDPLLLDEQRQSLGWKRHGRTMSCSIWRSLARRNR